MVHKKLLLHILAKLEWIVILIASMTGFVLASTPDTVYITTSGSTLTIAQSGTTLTQGTTSVYATTTASTIFNPAKVAILNNSTTVRSWNFPDYIFKINGSVATTTTLFVSGVTALNPGNVKSFKLLKDIQVVTSLPSVQDPTVTYIVGAKDTILVSGLDGNTDDSYKIIADVVNPTTSDNVILRFNNISASVYDWRYSYAGSTSAASGNAQTSMAVCPTSGSSSLNHISLEIDAKAGNNRHYIATTSQVGSSQQVVAGMLLSGGIWRDNSTKLTSMTFRYASISGGFGVGTRIRVFSLQP